jgi:hypothetical protein
MAIQANRWQAMVSGNAVRNIFLSSQLIFQFSISNAGVRDAAREAIIALAEKRFKKNNY